MISQLDACDVKLKAVLNEDPNNVRAIMLSAISQAKNKQVASAIQFLEVCKNRSDPRTSSRNSPILLPLKKWINKTV